MSLILTALGLPLYSVPAHAEPPMSPGAPVPVLCFVHLGDIWRYDDGTGRTTVAVPAQGRCLGHPSWSGDGISLAWEERRVVDGRQESRVVFGRGLGLSGGLEIKWTIEDASSPAVSLDGGFVSYESEENGVFSLRVVDSDGRPVSAIEDAHNGCWIATKEGPALAFERIRIGGSYTASELYVHYLSTGVESRLSLTDALAPQVASDGESLLFTSEGGNDAVCIAEMTDGVIRSVVDVTKNEAFDYRWRYGQNNTGVPYVELVPMAGGRSDISRATFSSDDPNLELSFLKSSFGWNASLPSQSPFPDLECGDPYYDAACCLWANQVINGFDDGTFHSESPVRRAQLAKMLDGCLGIPVYPGLPLTPFIDLGHDVSLSYPREYVSAAYQYGLVQGYGQGIFRPWNQVGRMQAVTMVVRAADAYLPWDLVPPPVGWVGATSGFVDLDHGYNVHLAEYSGLLEGIDLSLWNPRAPATRGEVAQMLVNLMRLRGPMFDSDALTGSVGPAAGAGTGAVPHKRSVLPLGNIVFDGDSLTAGSTATTPYPTQLMRQFPFGIEWSNLGIGGQRLKDMLDNAPSRVDPLCNAELGQNVVVVWGGTNDIRWWLHPPTAVYSHLKRYCLGRRASGYTVVVLTLLPRSDGECPSNFETDRQTVNRWIRASWSGFADALVDVGSDPFIGYSGCERDTRFFNRDRVHLNDSGLAVVAGRVGQVLKQLDAVGASLR